jgi:hypothetical protein
MLYSKGIRVTFRAPWASNYARGNPPHLIVSQIKKCFIENTSYVVKFFCYIAKNDILLLLLYTIQCMLFHFTLCILIKCNSNT